MLTCSKCPFFREQYICRSKARRKEIVWNYCQHPDMLDAGEKGVVTGMAGRPMGESNQTPAWCPFLRDDDEDEEATADLRELLKEQLERLNQRFEALMGGDGEQES